jgi:hypothetical protein
MVTLDPLLDLKNESEQIQELTERTFLLCWNIALALRFINRELNNMFEKRNINIAQEDVYQTIMREHRNKMMRISLLSYNPNPEQIAAPHYVDLPMEIALNYYYLLKRYQINRGIECRIGMNVGKCLEIFLGGNRLDHTYIGKEVDLAARMEGFARRNSIKMPRRVYNYLSKEFKEFIVSHVVEESMLTNRDLTHKMVFVTKREYPKGSAPIGTVEFMTNVGFFMRAAQDHFERLEELFRDLEPKRMEKRVDVYIQDNKFDMVEKLRKANINITLQSGDDLLTQIRSTPAIRRIIEGFIRKDIDKKILLLLEDIREDREAFRMVRNLVIRHDATLYRYYFIDRNLMSAGRKRKYFTDQLYKKFSERINFDLVGKDDIDQIVEDLYRKTYGKSE